MVLACDVSNFDAPNTQLTTPSKEYTSHINTMAKQIANCYALWLAVIITSSTTSSSIIQRCNAFSPSSLFAIRRQYYKTLHNKKYYCNTNNNVGNTNSVVLLMAGFPPDNGPMGPGGPMGGRGGGGFPPPNMGPPRPQRSSINQPSMGDNLGGSQSYNANRSAPNAGNTASQPRQGQTTSNTSGSSGYNDDNMSGGGGGRGLGAIASGVRTPMDKYGRMPEGPPRRPLGGGPGYNGGGFNDIDGPNRFGRGPPNFGPGGPDPRDSFGNNNNNGPQQTPLRGPDNIRGPDGRPINNLRYEERDYGEYVTNLRRGAAGAGGGGGGGRPPPELPPGSGEYRSIQDEVEQLRKENALLKRSCQDLLNNFNELSNRLFDVDESLKKVAKVFPDEDEMESLEWLLRR